MTRKDWRTLDQLARVIFEQSSLTTDQARLLALRIMREMKL